MNYKKISHYMTHPVDMVGWLCMHSYLKWLPDEMALKAIYRCAMHKKLDLKNPVTFNEKMQWLKLYDRRPEYTIMADKYAAKKWAADRIGEEYIIPTLGVWEHFDDIGFNALPDRFVLKCTHDSGSVMIVRDKEKLDKVAAKEKLEHALRCNYYDCAREWQYKDIPPRIIAEEYIDEADQQKADRNNRDQNGEPAFAIHGLNDYKILVFNGKAKAFYVTYDRGYSSGICIDVYDINCNRLPVTWGYKQSRYELIKPVNFEKMIELAEILGQDIPHVRVDFYNLNGRILLGELTLTTFAGVVPIEPREYDIEFGSWIHLPEKI